MMEPKWKEKSKEILKYRYVIAIFECKDNDGETFKELDILYFDGVGNRFHRKNGWGSILYKNILKWLPIPEDDNEITT